MNIPKIYIFCPETLDKFSFLRIIEMDFTGRT